MLSRKEKLVAVTVAAFFVMGISALFAWVALSGDDNTNPNKNRHAYNCVQIDGTIHTKEQWGGKFDTHTYWCENSDHQITDIWFD